MYGNCINLENGVGTMLIANEHHISAAGSGLGCIEVANSPFSSSGKGTAGSLTYNANNNLYQTLAQANSAGYSSSQAFLYSPTLATSPTVETIGANETGIGGSASADSTFACAQQTVNGVVESGLSRTTDECSPKFGSMECGRIPVLFEHRHATKSPDKPYCRGPVGLGGGADDLRVFVQFDRKVRVCSL